MCSSPSMTAAMIASDPRTRGRLLRGDVRRVGVGGEQLVGFGRLGRLDVDHPAALVRVAVDELGRVLVQRLDAVKDFEAHEVRELIVRTGKRSVVVALDGEVCRMAPPLHYRIRPKALPLLVARAAEAAA